MSDPEDKVLLVLLVLVFLCGLGIGYMAGWFVTMWMVT